MWETLRVTYKMWILLNYFRYKYVVLTLCGETRTVLVSSLNLRKSCVLVSHWTQDLQLTNWMNVGFFSHALERSKQTLTPLTEWKTTKSQSVFMKTLSTSSSSSIVWDASFFLGCHLQPPQCLYPNGFRLCLAATPHWCYALLGWSASWVFFFFSSPACGLRVREAINKHCASMARSCVAQHGITHAAWLCSLT